MRLTVVAGLLAALAACGDGNDPVVTGTTPPTGGGTATTVTAAQQSAFASDFGNGLAALNTYSGLTSSAFVDLFDDGFLDAGYNKPSLRANLAQEATARSTTPDLAFPGVTLSGVTITNCNAAGVCTLNATVTNADVDSTATPFTSLVRLQDGKVRLYGDQTQTPTT
ncbi:hypothetical protein GT347_18115 [Xylophilus rhododendri]|uniref:Nuclear transport factor 2 family protein n=1 Tax=Xylophilus rhododendri TaxID=2697032 RepID=A0A857J921_9BURK|nr:hypothetical protein GT347_18115 [Xylophilus rhododendri]